MNGLSGPIPTELVFLTRLAWFSVYNNNDLCGPIVDGGLNGGLGQNSRNYGYYSNGIGSTNIGNVCPTRAPTTTPTSAPTMSRPCCESLRENPVFCCIEARNPDFALSVCNECGY
jgi:hypothetical protein